MIIAYYRDTKGRIVSHQTIESMTLEKAAEVAEQFNENNKYGATATVAEVAEDGLEAYLIERADARLKVLQGAKEDALTALHEAMRCIEGLEVMDR